MINPQIEDSWKRVLWDQFQAPYFAQLKAFLVEEKRQYQVFPPGPCIFNAFNSTPFDEVKVVIIGQDPYHDVGQAHGLCFSVQDGVPFPRSLQNIFKELHDDVGFQMPRSGNLQKWAAQGILLLNATLTVRAHCAGSHQGHGWETFTDCATSPSTNAPSSTRASTMYSPPPTPRPFPPPGASSAADTSPRPTNCSPVWAKLPLTGNSDSARQSFCLSII